MNASLDPHQLFSHLATDKPVVVAVSGGSDSLALLHLASSWAKSRNLDLRAVTVDHGLRPEAAAEAGFVSGVCEGLFIEHYTLAWEGIKPTTGISQAARSARYLLIEEFARDVGAQFVLTGHTMDDQAETLWMRNSRDGGNPQYRGLSGMAPHMILPNGVTVVRPLLGVRRDTLREHLAQIGQSWVEDPSNFDTSYERVRARQALLDSPVDVPLIARFADANAGLRKLRNSTVCNVIRDNLVIADGPVFSMNAACLQNLDEGNAVLSMQILIAISGGREHLVSHDLALSAIAVEASQRLTAGGCVIERKGSAFRIHRENRNLPLIRLEPGDRQLWDGRLMLENQTSRTFICRTMGSSEIRQIEKEAEKKFSVQPRAVLQSMPVIYSATDEPLFPFVRGGTAIPDLSWHMRFPAIDHYCASYDSALLELTGFVMEQMGDAIPSTDGGFKAS